jgi:MFS transporter, DHA1 family, multidrug resistance protein
MLSKPIFSKFSEKTYDLALLCLTTLIYITLCAEADMYVPAFPEMIGYFKVAENKIQLILSLNFAAICIAGLVAGPLSDSFGRRKVLVLGLLLLVISSLGCVFVNSFTMMLFFRILQGISAAVPMVVTSALFFDRYSSEKAGQILGILNMVISACMAIAPIAGAYLIEVYNWRANFIVIFLLALTSFLGALFFTNETLPVAKRKPLSLVSTLKDYMQVCTSYEFIIYCIIANFPITAILVYISSLSVIFVNHLGMALSVFSYYQASSTVSFVIFSLLSTKLIKHKGIEYCKNLGGLLCVIGSFCMLIVALTNHTSPILICFAMSIVTAGGALLCAPFCVKLMSVFPSMNGTALSVCTAFRQISTSGLVIISEIMFDGTIIPIAYIIFAYMALSLIGYFILYTQRKEYITN